jgi:DUF2905 family protein
MGTPGPRPGHRRGRPGLDCDPSILWLGQLPGDIRIERGNFRFYFPLVTCLLLNLFLSLVLWLVRLFRG